MTKRCFNQAVLMVALLMATTTSAFAAGSLANEMEGLRDPDCHEEIKCTGLYNMYWHYEGTGDTEGEATRRAKRSCWSYDWTNKDQRQETCQGLRFTCEPILICFDQQVD